MQINGIGNGMNTAELRPTQDVSTEESAEIKTGTTEETVNAKNAYKTTEQALRIGRNVDIKP